MAHFEQDSRLVDHPQAGLLWLVQDFSELEGCVQECAAPVATYREVSAWWGKRRFPLEAVLVVKTVFPGSEVIEHRGPARAKRAGR